MKNFTAILLCLSLLISCEKLTFLKGDKTEELKKIDEILFPYLLTSFMWNTPSLSTDEMDQASFEWVRFRSALGEKFSDAADFCFGVKQVDQRIELSLLQIQEGQTCAGESNKVLFSVKDLKRVMWRWPTPAELKTKKEVQLDFEWIENTQGNPQWKKISFKYELPYYPINQQNLSWGKTWRNQKPYLKFDWVNPKNSIFIKTTNAKIAKVAMSRIPHQNSVNWQKAQVCFAIDDNCQPLIAEQCHLCEHAHFTLYNTKCKTHGTTYCGEIQCGHRSQPACYLGQHHIKQDDFKGCSPFTEEWFCHQGLEIKCTKEGPICY